MRIYQRLASLIAAVENCAKSANVEWQEEHEDEIERLTREYLPSGSGFDSGASLDMVRSTPERLIFESAYHHMNEHGFYDVWSHFDVVIEPSLQHGFTIRLRSKGKWPARYRDTKEYISETFADALNQEV